MYEPLYFMYEPVWIRRLTLNIQYIGSENSSYNKSEGATTNSLSEIALFFK